jgi:hypothetical protein
MLLVVAGCATPALAGVPPYIRLEYGGTLMRMTDANSLIHDNETFFKSYGYSASFHKIGASFGPALAAGFWVRPGFRLGATISYQRALRHNGLNLPTYVFYSDDLDFRMTEIGIEAAARFERLHGFTIGANVGQGRAEATEHLTIVDSYGDMIRVHSDSARHKLTFGGYVGIDQANPSGFAGFFRAGFQYRDMGRMPGHAVASDGVSTVEGDTHTVWLDYSGIYVKFGIGYDGAR